MAVRNGVVVVGLALTLLAGPALADQIDGDWCFPADGRNLTIKGDAIVTPSGTNTTGHYTRHAFRYKVPEGDPGAGSEVQMRQLNDQTMVLSPPDAEEETWKRCKLQVS
ncbi:MAG: hypothetical protein ACFB6S_04845 [Geminicoccaceae bacterium]